VAEGLRPKGRLSEKFAATIHQWRVEYWPAHPEGWVS